MYRIQQKRQWYASKINAMRGWHDVTDGGGFPIEYHNREDAQALIDRWQSTPYECSHGESGAPEYRVVADPDADLHS